MQRVAYGLLGLKPHEFWSLTLKEFHWMMEGYRLKEDQEWRKIAQLASWTMSPHLKRPIRADQLYRPQQQRKKSATEARTDFEALQKAMGF